MFPFPKNLLEDKAQGNQRDHNKRPDDPKVVGPPTTRVGTIGLKNNTDHKG